ncbi:MULTISPECIES: flagellar motor switch protein FliM [unclassified Actinotalea]|uniref:flagellar motor switch protein FliM n=1 Tax=unclassified Actinotalea TaxID=2638618 RepID=UPI00210789B1|nr:MULTISPECIES: flagellar motor switch protein FliM [unclassified Actinotalea]
MTVTEAAAAPPTHAGRRAPGAPPRAPELYDFRRPMTLAREHGRVLEMAFETYARQWSTLLTSRLRVVASATLVSVQLHSYDEYVRPLPTHTAMILCGVEQGRSTAVVQLPVDTATLWVDYLLGGPGIALPDTERELTDIEWRLVRDLVQVSLGDLAYAFAAVRELDVHVKSVQYAPQFVQAAGASDPVLVARFELVTGERRSTATLMLPADVLLAPLRAGENAVVRSVDEVRQHDDALARLAAQVHEVPVRVSVRLAPVTVTPAQLTDLAVGDLVPLTHRVGTPLDVVVDDVVLAGAALGSNGSRLACLVVTSEESTR